MKYMSKKLVVVKIGRSGTVKFIRKPPGIEVEVKSFTK